MLAKKWLATLWGARTSKRAMVFWGYVSETPIPKSREGSRMRSGRSGFGFEGLP